MDPPAVGVIRGRQFHSSDVGHVLRLIRARAEGVPAGGVDRYTVFAEPQVAAHLVIAVIRRVVQGRSDPRRYVELLDVVRRSAIVRRVEPLAARVQARSSARTGDSEPGRFRVGRDFNRESCNHRLLSGKTCTKPLPSSTMSNASVLRFSTTGSGAPDWPMVATSTTLTKRVVADCRGESVRREGDRHRRPRQRLRAFEAGRDVVDVNRVRRNAADHHDRIGSLVELGIDHVVRQHHAAQVRHGREARLGARCHSGLRRDGEGTALDLAFASGHVADANRHRVVDHAGGKRIASLEDDLDILLRQRYRMTTRSGDCVRRLLGRDIEVAFGNFVEGDMDDFAFRSRVIAVGLDHDRVSINGRDATAAHGVVGVYCHWTARDLLEAVTVGPDLDFNLVFVGAVRESAWQPERD